MIHFARPGITNLENKVGYEVSRSGLMSAYAGLSLSPGRSVGERASKQQALLAFHESILAGRSSVLTNKCYTSNSTGCIETSLDGHLPDWAQKLPLKFGEGW